MLSRIAESLYWIGRLVERAEDTARLLDVHVSVLLEDTTADEQDMCRRVLATLGVGDSDNDACDTTEQLLELTAYSPAGPITGALATARENARTVREAISSEMWEALNTTRNALATQRSRGRRVGPQEFFSYVKLRTALVSGLADTTLSRDDGWYFLALGRNLERVDMTVRILSVGGALGDPQLASVALLRACGAFEAYLRTYRAAVATRQVAEFLLLDRLFPRSVFSALSEAERALRMLTPTPTGRTGVADRGLLALGRARTALEFADRGTAADQLPQQLGQLQAACADASEAIADRFFDRQGVITWTADR
jgi:uncharacterized alpha-E superfamily protein